MAVVALKIASGAEVGRVWTFDEPCRVVIGHAADCGLRLVEDDPRVAARHCLLEIDPPNVELRDLGSPDGTLVNGVKIGGAAALGVAKTLPFGSAAGADTLPFGGPSPPVAIMHGDRIEIGRAAITCEITGAAKPHVPVAEPTDVELDAAVAEIPGYERVRLLNRGGMGAVYHLTRRRDGADLVVKMMLSSLTDDARAQAMFQREIALTRALAHPNIVPLREDGNVGRFRYFVMEYCAGGSAEDLVVEHGGKLPVRDAMTIVLQALAGLAHAHQQGIVHRDIKPGNILLSAKGGGVARLTDFGLAKRFELVPHGFAITSTGMHAGTPDFMPREQLLDYKGARPPSDVWAMGATLHYLITGAAPRADSPAKDVVSAVLINPVVPIRHREPALSEAIASVIDRALADEPAARFPDGNSMCEALLAALD